MLDTNVILKALIKDSVVRGIILFSNHEFLVPAYLIDETERHLEEVVKKSGLSKSETNAVMDDLFAHVQVVPADEVISKWKEAEEIMERVDKNDVAFVAAALGTSCDGIWSDDKHLKRQRKVKVWTTKDVARLSSRG